MGSLCVSPLFGWPGLALVVDTVRRGELFIPFHFGLGSQSANQHTWYARDPVSMQPQLKSAPGQIRRRDFGSPERWLLDRRGTHRGVERAIRGTHTWQDGDSSSDPSGLIAARLSTSPSGISSKAAICRLEIGENFRRASLPKDLNSTPEISFRVSTTGQCTH